jgi:GNAT superfamily N-acetyltransferase
MRIVRSRPEDAATLTAIAFEAKRGWGYPERWIQGWAPTLTILPGYISSFQTFSAVEGTDVAGCCALRTDGAEARIDHLWVLPASWRKGVGRALFRHAEAAARAAGATVLVIESDPNAEGFYLAMGAARVGRVPAPMDGVERFLPLMEKGLR